MEDVQRFEHDALFKLEQPFHDPFRRALFAVMKRPLSRLLALKKFNKIYDAVRNVQGGHNFID
ncbi:MAG: hypothetical protein KKC99_11980, partial [Proteobacteria bacterium]|nr:hypothetical protein [Pseudomonadota bacterium]